VSSWISENIEFFSPKLVSANEKNNFFCPFNLLGGNIGGTKWKPSWPVGFEPTTVVTIAKNKLI
jgi:hypothetical protein